MVASPQIENGHIDIANELAHAFMRLKINGVQTRLLWVIWRKTYGWHKKEDYISISQFQALTNLDRGLICRELKKLEQRNIIKTKDRAGKTTLYSFNKDYEGWRNPEVLTKQSIALLTKQSTGVDQTVNSAPIQPLLTKQSTTKEIYIKEIIQKKVQDFFDYFCLKTKKSFKLTEDKIGLIKKRFEEGYTPEQLRLAADNFIQDPWEGRAQHLDLLYCIGRQKGKADNLEKWLNWIPKNRPQGAAARELK